MAELRLSQALALTEADAQQIQLSQALTLVESDQTMVRLSQVLVLVELVPTPPRFPQFITGIRMTDFYQLPEEVTGYALDQGTSFWKVCVPEATINLLDDPSWETETTDLGSLIYMGARSKKTNDTLLTKTFIATVTGAHTFSFYVANQDANFYDDVYVKIEGGVIGEEEQITIEKAFPTKGNHQWVRCEITFPCVVAGQYQVGISSYSPARYISTDCWQVEAKPYATTYVDGDMGMWFPEAASEYYWTGLRHRSTSVRTNRTRTGGKLVSLEDYDFKTTSVIGLGATPIDIPFQQLLSGRIVPGQARYRQREFIIGGAMFGCSLDKLNFNRRALASLFRPKVNNITEPVRLHVRFSEVDDEFQLFAYYLDGLEGNVTNIAQERLAIRLGTGEFPHYMNNFHGQQMNGVTSVAGTDKPPIFMVDEYTGQWTTLNYATFYGDDATQDPPIKHIYHAKGMVVDIDENVYVYGYFPDLFVKAGDTPEAINANLSGDVIYDVAYIADTTYPFVAGGKIGALDDESNEYYGVALYNADDEVWEPLGNGLYLSVDNDPIAYSVLWHNGYVYVGGLFTLALDSTYTSTATNNVARYNIENDTWEDLGMDFDGGVYDIVLGPDGLIYVSGSHTASDVNDDIQIQTFDPNTGTVRTFAPRYFSPLPDVVPYPTVYFHNMIFDQRGNLIVSGYEINDDLIPDWGSNYMLVVAIARGSTWSRHYLAQDQLIDPVALAHIVRMGVDKFGRLTIGNNFSTWDGNALPKYRSPLNMVWDVNSDSDIAPRDLLWAYSASYGSDYAHAPTMSYGAKTYVIPPQPDSSVLLMHTGNPTTIQYGGTAPTRARLYMQGNGILTGIYNYTNRQQIVFANPLEFRSNEDIIIYEKDGALFVRRIGMVNSSDVAVSVLPSASSWTALDLYPGANIITAMFQPLGYLASYGQLFLLWQDAFDAL